MNKHIIDGLEFKEDLHSVYENADYSLLDALYKGRTAYYGDFHCHTNSGGTSDGKFTLKDWLMGMKELKLDFVGIMDHKQVRHLYLDEFDSEYFIYGTEPGGRWICPELSFHYLMIFQKRDSLLELLKEFPDVYEFEGSIDDGSYKYKKVEKERFLQVVNAVHEKDGVVVHAHPKQLMKSEDIDDYYFGEGSVIEIIYTKNPQTLSNDATKNNYKLWLDMLDKGYKVINTATNDSHYNPAIIALNTVYSNIKQGSAYVEYLKKGDLNSGFIGIKMSIENNPMGASVEYREGMKLYIKINDAHPYRFDKNETYRLDVLTDKGLAFSDKIDLSYQICLNVKKRRFYRAVIIRESDGAPAAIGNPVWLE